MAYLAVDVDSNQPVDGAISDAEPAAEDELLARTGCVQCER